MIRQFELLEKVKAYNPDTDEDLINKAYVYAMKAHGSQTRASGDPYFSHPLEVAYILTDLKLDDASIATALLHDTVEDTDTTIEDIKKHFGGEVAALVDGVTKLSKLEDKSEELRQAENFRKLVVAMSEDIRVLLVKLSDRLHNMRTIGYIKKEEKRKRISHETIEVYATLAERIGMRQFKEELQDLAFAELHPEARSSIVNRLSFLRKEGQPMVDRILKRLEKTIDESGVDGVISGREKKPFSIWKKMEANNISFEQLSDIMAFRVIVADIGACYQVLGSVHHDYHMVPGRFKDYVSTPKPNGYRSIHTTVFGPENQRIEIQIRTQEMHDIAEYGVAAHWSYKQQADAKKDGKQFRWIRELVELLDKTADAKEFVEHSRMEMYHEHVFCFSPKGDLIELPAGATPVDFAFAVHSAVGQTCVGAKVNGRIIPLRTRLQNGDQVEIIRSKTQTPSPAWERFVVTGKARSEIRKYVRTQQRKEYVTLGKAILQKFFRQEGHDLTEKMLEPALKILDRKESEDLYAAVGEGIIHRNQVYEAIFPGQKSKQGQKKGFFTKFRRKPSDGSGREAIPIKGLIPGMAVHFAGCCHPIPGDRIVGIVTTGKGVTIHTIDCDTLENFSDQPERWVDVAWEMEEADSSAHIGRIKALVAHEAGTLATIANVISQDMGNISNLKIINRSSDFFEILLDVEVEDVRHLNNIIAALRAKPAIQSVERYQG